MHSKSLWQHQHTHTHTAPHLNHGTLIVTACIGLARTIYIRCTYGIFGLDITKYMVYIYVYIRFWPTLCMQDGCVLSALAIGSN
jgi:hypothetical protein